MVKTIIKQKEAAPAVLPPVRCVTVFGTAAYAGQKFASPERIGPKFVADFEDIRNSDERAVRTRDAYERVNYLLSALDVR